MVNLIIIALILCVGIAVGMNWEIIKKTSLPGFAVMRVQAGHGLQNAYAAVSSFFTRFNFWSSPDEGGVSVPSVDVENLLPGHVPVGALVSAPQTPGPPSSDAPVNPDNAAPNMRH